MVQISWAGGYQWRRDASNPGVVLEVEVPCVGEKIEAAPTPETTSEDLHTETGVAVLEEVAISRLMGAQATDLGVTIDHHREVVSTVGTATEDRLLMIAEAVASELIADHSTMILIVVLMEMLELGAFRKVQEASLMREDQQENLTIEDLC
jgi:hypothetical protein